MPTKWTPANVQMLLWLAWGHQKYDAQKVVDAWPSIPGEETPTKRAVGDRINGIRKGVDHYGLAAFFGNGTLMPRKSKKAMLPKPDDVDSKSTIATTTTNGLQSTYVKKELPDAVIKSEGGGGGDDDDTIAVDGQQPSQYLATPPKTPGGRGVTKASNGRKKRRRGSSSSAETGSDSANITPETSPSDLFFPPSEFEMKLRPDHRNFGLFESGDESNGSDAAWVPGGGGSEGGRDKRKRVRRH